jgi:hypothetical protein
MFFNNIIIFFHGRFWGRYLLDQPLHVLSVPASLLWQVDIWHSQGEFAAVCPRAGRKHPNYTARYMSYEDNTDRIFCYSPSKVTIYTECVVVRSTWFIVGFRMLSDWELISEFGTPEASKFLNLPTRTVIMNFRVGVCFSQMESWSELQINENCFYLVIIVSWLLYFYELFIL